MSETLICPYCERIVDVDAMENCTLWHDRAELAARLGKVWRIANEYADCFRAKQGVRMSLKKRVRILTEVARLWEKCVYEYDGKRYKVQQDEIVNGMRLCCDKDLIGFQNHNYLKVILVPKSQRISHEGMTAKEEGARDLERLREARKGDLEGLGNLFPGQQLNNVDTTLELKTDDEERLLSREESKKRAAEVLRKLSKKAVKGM